MGKYTTSCYAYMYKACYNVARSENCTRLQTRTHDNCSCSCETGLVKPNATIFKVCLIWALSERHHVEAFAKKTQQHFLHAVAIRPLRLSPKYEYAVSDYFVNSAAKQLGNNSTTHIRTLKCDTAPLLSYFCLFFSQRMIGCGPKLQGIR